MVTARAVTRKTTFPYLESLDGLRGLLVFPVALYHFSLTAGTDNIIAKGSFFAPSVFFALSGFLITSLLLIEHEKTGALDWRGFWKRRFRRLVPASVAIV
ncbi:MAG: acyltransferase family protein, partial [Propionicimonas sp.]|nr:acyltransferase family protein [Propionicimonas sp.]